MGKPKYSVGQIVGDRVVVRGYKRNSKPKSGGTYELKCLKCGNQAIVATNTMKSISEGRKCFKCYCSFLSTKVAYKVDDIVGDRVVTGEYIRNINALGGTYEVTCLKNNHKKRVANSELKHISEGQKCMECRKESRYSTVTNKHLVGIWHNMRSRCRPDANGHNKEYYYDRDITVCDEWMEWKVFCDWALSNGYKKGLEIDRINNDKGYAPDNCRWVTRSQNMRNTRQNVYVEWNGHLKTLVEWWEDPRCQVTYNKFRKNILKGQTVEEAWQK